MSMDHFRQNRRRRLRGLVRARRVPLRPWPLAVARPFRPASAAALLPSWAGSRQAFVSLRCAGCPASPRTVGTLRSYTRSADHVAHNCGSPRPSADVPTSADVHAICRRWLAGSAAFRCCAYFPSQRLWTFRPSAYRWLRSGVRGFVRRPRLLLRTIRSPAHQDPFVPSLRHRGLGNPTDPHRNWRACTDQSDHQPPDRACPR
mmetsp:Transcript_22686/g.37285  ORF Transcript_22686/g.37285 Transcript_22686/m.37285 type:complete len:203 (-) Transcript_22686:2179-2787(-)